VQEPKWRVKTLLMKLESVRKAIAKKEPPSDELLAIRHKFMAETESIFSGLPKPKDMRSFEGNDLPLLFAPAEVQEPKWRVKSLLMKLDSYRRIKARGDDPGRELAELSNKFVGQTEAIFSGLPKPKDWNAFQNHDLPLLFTPAEVQEFAVLWSRCGKFSIAGDWPPCNRVASILSLACRS
jgi:hypothetical protein